jgi:hypothetical protein
MTGDPQSPSVPAPTLSNSDDTSRQIDSAKGVAGRQSLDLFKVAVTGTVLAIGMTASYYYLVTLPNIRREEIRLQAMRTRDGAHPSGENSGHSPDASDEAVRIARDTQDEVAQVQRQLDELKSDKPSEVTPPKEPPGAPQVSPRAAMQPSVSVAQVPVQPTMEQVAATAFGPVLQRTRMTANQFSADYRRYEESCEGKTTNGSWVLPLDPDSGVYVANTEIRNETTPSCRSLLSDLIQSADTIKTNIDAVEEAARVRGIWPGVVRDLYAKYVTRSRLRGSQVTRST